MEEIKDIIKECALGNVRAQEKLYRMFAPKMFGVCLRYSRDRAEAEDNLQDGFVKIFTSIDSFRYEGSFEGWIRRIMINTSLEKFRKHNQLYPVDNVYEYVEDIGYEDIISKISFDDLLQMIRELPPQYRTVFNLYVMEDLPHKEISKVMGITEGTSKSNLSRARNLLQEKVINNFGLQRNKTKMVI